MDRFSRTSRVLLGSLALAASLSATGAFAGTPNPLGYVSPEGLRAGWYHIIDFKEIGLPAPGEGEIWIRMGDDAKLVTLTTGEVHKVMTLGADGKFAEMAPAASQ